MTKEVNAIKIDTPQNLSSAKQVLQAISSSSISTVNWADYSVKPEVTFVIAHDNSSFYIHYSVKNEKVRAVTTEINGEVYEDSCCEFFFAPDDKGYYNIEINAIGTCLVGYGIGHDRVRLPNQDLKAIRVLSSLATAPVEASASETDWDMIVEIPFSVFLNHPDLTVAGKTFSANFFKCGDKTPEMHFLSWNPIATAQPNFHVMECFGKLNCEK